jgi:hypothetical protein
LASFPEDTEPARRWSPFDHADWVFEAKFDGFRAAADTVRGRLISRLCPLNGVDQRPRRSSWARHYHPVRLGRSCRSAQFGRASAPMVPQLAHTMRGPNDGTGT